MRVVASGIRLPSPQAATAVSAEAQKILAISGTILFSPRRRILRRSR